MELHSELSEEQKDIDTKKASEMEVIVSSKDVEMENREVSNKNAVCVITLYIEKVTECVIKDELTNMNDYILNLQLNNQKFSTQTYYRQQYGKCVFDESFTFILHNLNEIAERRSYLRLSLWDQDIITSNDCIGEVLFNMQNVINKGNDIKLQQISDMFHPNFPGEPQAKLHFSMSSHIYDNLQQYYSSIHMHQNCTILKSFQQGIFDCRGTSSVRHYDTINYSDENKFIFCKAKNNKMIQLKYDYPNEKSAVKEFFLDEKDKCHIYNDNDEFIDDVTVYSIFRFYDHGSLKALSAVAVDGSTLDAEIAFVSFNGNNEQISDLLEKQNHSYSNISIQYEIDPIPFREQHMNQCQNVNCAIIKYQIVKSQTESKDSTNEEYDALVETKKKKDRWVWENPGLYPKFIFCGNYKLLYSIQNWICDHKLVLIDLFQNDHDADSGGFNLNILDDVKPVPKIPNISSEKLLAEYLKPITEQYNICYNTEKDFIYFVDKVDGDQWIQLMNIDLTRYVKVIVRYLMLKNLLKGQDNEFNIYKSFYFDTKGIKVSFAILSLVLSVALAVGIVYFVINEFIEKEIFTDFGDIDGLIIVLSLLVFFAISWLTRSTVSAFIEFYSKSIPLFDLPWFYISADFVTNVIVSNVICIISFFLLVSSETYGDLVLNGFALTFIMEIDDLLNVFESDEDDLLHNELSSFLLCNPYHKWKKKITYEWKDVFIILICPFAIFISLFESIQAFMNFFLKKIHKKKD